MKPFASVVEVCHCPNGEKFTAQSFFTEIASSNSQWWNSSRTTPEWVFRGHSDSSWKLLPSAWRSDGSSKLRNLIESLELVKLDKLSTPEGRELWASLGIDEESLCEHPIVPWVNAEIEALHQFVSKSDSLGLKVDPLCHDTHSILETNRRWLYYLFDIKVTQSRLQQTALAQHHGIPTRLLDWTTSAHLAAFHAVNARHSDTDISIWALRKKSDFIFETESGKSYQALSFYSPPYHSNQYLKAQKGLFTYCGFGEIFFYENGYWPALEDMKARERNETERSFPYLKKLVLAAEHVPELRKILDMEGYSLSGCMPTFDNVSKDVISQWG